MESTKCFTLKDQSAATVGDWEPEHEGATSGLQLFNPTSLLLPKARHYVLITLEHQLSWQALRTFWYMVS